jgi:hypothetical protein
MGLIKIPKRLEKEHNEIIEELRNYREFRDRNMVNRDKELGR